MLNEQLVELGREACSRLSISGSRSVSEFSETISCSSSNAQNPTVTFKAYEQKDSSCALLGTQERFKEIQVECNKAAPRSSPGACNFSQILSSSV